MRSSLKSATGTFYIYFLVLRYIITRVLQAMCLSVNKLLQSERRALFNWRGFSFPRAQSGARHGRVRCSGGFPRQFRGRRQRRAGSTGRCAYPETHHRRVWANSARVTRAFTFQHVFFKPFVMQNGKLIHLSLAKLSANEPRIRKYEKWRVIINTDVFT